MAYSSEKVDRRQLKALVRAGLKTDLRGAHNPLGGMGRSQGSFPPLLGVLIFYILIGIFMAAVQVAGLGNFFVASMIVNASLMTFIAISILMEFSSIILTPEDWDVVAPLPVNSKTFFVAKLLNLLIYVGILGSAVSLPPAIAYGAVTGNILAALVLFLSSLAAATTTATFFIIFYSLMLHVTNRERMNSLLSYLQLVLIFGFYFIMFVLPRQMGDFTQAVANIHIWWLPLLPPGWFSSLPALLVQPVQWTRLLGGGLALLSLAICLLAALKNLSLNYARSLQDSKDDGPSAAVADAVVRRHRWSRWQPPEFRVVARLIRTQFKFDNRFKVTVLAAIPLAVMYIYLGISAGRTLIDPFLPHTDTTPEGGFLIYIAVALIPVMVLSNITMSSSWQAAWVFLTSPTDRVHLIRAAKRYALLYFAVPFLVIVFGVQVYFYGSPVHALLHSITLYLLSLVGITLMVTLTGQLPFSLPPRKGQRTLTFMFGWLGPFVLVVPPMVIIAKFGYGGYGIYAAIVGGLLIINVLLSLLEGRVLHRRVDKFEFADE